MKKFIYILFRFLTAWFSITPFCIIYLFSDITFLVVYYVLGYRKKVVYSNLKNSFPKKNDKEINKIALAYYRHLCDISVETIKGITLSQIVIKRRYHVVNPEILDKYFERGSNIICLASHYNNWEYGILALGPALKHQAVSIYLPFTNPYMEKYGVRERCKYGMEMIPVNQTKEYFSRNHPKPFALILAADQSPSNPEKFIWVDFLQQDTACLHGAEAYSKKLNAPLVYFDVQKTRRGFYRLKMEILVENPLETSNGEITAAYMKRLEKDIVSNPQFWLWSHKRWKHKRN
ncbi:MAG TPA: lysophospholipid acyltransferase family protein [Bacteroidales bacterium]|nr:lysophospholipid acyltransferase family protein [Bacteroidales bacterium]HQP03292.1 lysophospholipid acyltransferase family protein [Bacteroidales bacterium]